ncbi:MAG: glycerol-3-phosphate acyltransferase [Candidatus Pacebacteria bacterium]|nr:glycerol-3-phosphate acyltransferase [Candidatus Paceibacterota bacterium]
MEDIIIYILIAIFSFGLGSIPFAYFFGKIALKEDLRDSGSKNTGALNTLRASSRKHGSIIGVLSFLCVFLLDAGKAVLAAYLATGFINNQSIAIAIATFFVVLGHNYSPFLNFKGGRGAASFFGIILFYNPKAFLGYLIILFSCILIGEVFAKRPASKNFFKRAVSNQIIGRIIGEIIGVFYIGFAVSELFLTALITTPLIIIAHTSRIKDQIKKIKNKTYLND